MTTVAATKTISFRSPYTGATFQNLTSLLAGRDGYLAGGEAVSDGGVITVQPVTFVQRGIVVSSTAPAVITPPGLPVPWFVLASVADDDPDSGATLTATADLAAATAGIVIAYTYEYSGPWINAVSMNLAAVLDRDSETGVEEGVVFRSEEDIFGVVGAVRASRGRVVDPTGRRASVVGNGIPVRPNGPFDRNDHIVLRQIEAFTPEVKAIIGSAIGPSPAPVIVDSAGALSPSHYAKRGGGAEEQWLAWGLGVNLKIKGGINAEAFAATTLLSVSTITATCLPGQRVGDSAVLLLYANSTTLKLRSFDPTDGSTMDADVVIAGGIGAITHVRAVMDASEQLHVVYEQDDGGFQQVYYIRVSGASASFATVLVPARIVNGVSSGLNDTWPSIGLDRRGIATVAHIRGTGANEFGDLVVVTIDQQGGTVEERVLAVGVAPYPVGIDLGTTYSPTGYPGTGVIQAIYDNVRRTSVVVTPHDEVYVFTIGDQNGGSPRHILVHSPLFMQQHGVELINPIPEIKGVGDEIVGFDVAVGDAGEIYLCHEIESPTTLDTRLVETTLATPLLALGTIPQPVMGPREIVRVVGGAGVEDPRVTRGVAGEFVVNYGLSTNTFVAQRAPLNEVVGTAEEAELAAPQRHPRDLYLGTWSVPKSSSVDLSGWDPRMSSFSVRPKRMNYPVLVGGKGDFQGFNGLAQAVAEADRQGGGEVILRPGIHRLGAALGIPSGISIRGEGMATIVAESSSGVCTFNGRPLCTVTISGNVITDTGGNLDLAYARAGDVVFMAASGFHVVARNLGFDLSSQPFLVLEDSPAGAPAGATAILYAAGGRLENLTLALQVSSVNPVVFFNAYRPIIRNVRLTGPTTTGIALQGCLEPLIDGLDLTGVVNTDANMSLYLEESSHAVIRGVKFKDGQGRFYIGEQAHDTHIINCASDNSDPTKVIYTLNAGRTSPVYMSNCEGRISAADLDKIITNVGKRIRMPEGGGELEFEDDNTRASTIVLDGIKLTSATHKEFDGVSTDTITDAVNERVKVGGDTMTGALSVGVGVTVTGGGTLGALDNTLRSQQMDKLGFPAGRIDDVVLNWNLLPTTAYTFLGSGIGSIGSLSGGGIGISLINGSTQDKQLMTAVLTGQSAVAMVLEFEIVSNNATALLDRVLTLGYTADVALSTAKQLCFYKDSASANWVFRHCDGAAAATDVPLGVAAGAAHRFRIEYVSTLHPSSGGTTQARAYLDGVLVATATTNLPTPNGLTFGARMSSATTTSLVQVRTARHCARYNTGDDNL